MLALSCRSPQRLENVQRDLDIRGKSLDSFLVPSSLRPSPSGDVAVRSVLPQELTRVAGPLKSPDHSSEICDPHVLALDHSIVAGIYVGPVTDFEEWNIPVLEGYNLSV